MPVAKNAPRQPSTWPPMETPLSTGISAPSAMGTKMPPTLDPELNKPVASARSFLGNHSATVLMAAGKLPPSPRPSKMRTRKNPAMLVTSAWLMEASPQNAQAITKPQRKPMTSITRPMTSRLTA